MLRFPERLTTARLTLRRPVTADAPAIYEEYAGDPAVTKYLMWRPHRSLGDTAAFLTLADEGWVSGKSLAWAITYRDSDRVIGMIGARPSLHKTDIGYVLGRRHWGQGIMTEAGRAIVELLFQERTMYRVWATCDTENHASARVLEKLGMAREGILRRYIIHPNISEEPRDSLLYATVR